MATVQRKPRLSSAEVVERLSTLLEGDDPAMCIPIAEIHRRHTTADDRRNALRELAVRRGKHLPTWA